jgi:hypothetical protein
MNTWWVNLGEELRRKWWRSWDNGRQIAELRLLKLWIRQSDPIAKEMFSEDQMVRLRARIMRSISEP